MLIRLQEVRYIIVDEITRLHRSVAKSFLEQTISFEITNAHVKIIQVKGDTIDLSKFDQNLIQMLRTQINDEQIANQKKKSMETRNRIKNEGVFCNFRFFGAIYDGSKKFHFDPGQAQVIKFAFRSILDGKTYSQIHYEINQQFSDCLGKAKMFYESSLRNLLSQPIYAGYMYNCEGELIRCLNSPESLISIQDFLKVQKIMGYKRKNRKHPRTDSRRKRFLPLSGLLKCGHCHGNLVVSVDDGRVFYKCIHSVSKNCPECRQINVVVSHDRIKEHFGLLNTLKPLLILAFLERGRKNQSYKEGEKNIEKLKIEELRIQGKLKKAFELFCEDVLDEETYVAITKDRMAKLKKFHSQIREIELNVGYDYDSEYKKNKEDLAHFLVDYQNIDEKTCEQLLIDSVKQILAYPNYVVIETVYGMIKLDRYCRDKKQKSVFPHGRLFQVTESDSDEKKSYVIEYDYRPNNLSRKSQNECEISKIIDLPNLEIKKITCNCKNG